MMDSSTFQPKIFSKPMVRILHNMYASIVWLGRGKIINDDFSRINDDWYTARRMVGFRLANDIFESCENKICHSIPAHYFPFLSSISLQEYKDLSAYFFWETFHERKILSSYATDSIYFNACDVIEKRLFNHNPKKYQPIPKYIIVYIKNCITNSRESIIKRKAWWNGMSEERGDNNYNWQKAEKFTDTIYKPFLSSSGPSKTDIANSIKMMDENPHLTNMFEYCLRCHLLKYSGLKRIPGHNKKNHSLYYADSGLPFSFSSL